MSILNHYWSLVYASLETFSSYTIDYLKKYGYNQIEKTHSNKEVTLMNIAITQIISIFVKLVKYKSFLKRL